MRLALLALASGLIAGVAAQAESAVPSQGDWDAARQTITTDEGLTLAYVELGTGEGTRHLRPVLDGSRAQAHSCNRVPTKSGLHLPS